MSILHTLLLFWEPLALNYFVHIDIINVFIGVTDGDINMVNI